jgi:putative tryptophan/tyrosine transport system substrate-binding protein
MERTSRRRFLQASLSLAGLGPLAGCAPPLPNAPRAKVHRIGFLASLVSRPDYGWYDAFVDGLRNYGYVESHNVIIEYRSSEGITDRLPELAAQLVKLPVDILVAAATPAARAAKQATGAIPIVFTVVADPVEQGLVASLARPGGNVTGLSTLTPELSAKRVQLLGEALPGLSRVAVLWPSANPGQALAFRETEASAGALGLELQSVPVRVPDDLEAAFEAVISGRAEALIELPALPVRGPQPVVDFAMKSRLPSIHSGRETAMAGALMALGPDYQALFRRVGYFVDKILKGATPADLPTEQPTTFEFLINLKTAGALGLTIPQSVLLQATEVIQ